MTDLKSKKIRFDFCVTITYQLFSCLLLGEERLKGRFVIHIFVAVYLFIALAFICDKYFLPTVEVICQKLNLTQVSSNLILCFPNWDQKIAARLRLIATRGKIS